MKALRTPADGAALAQQYLTKALPLLSPGDKPTVALGIPDQWSPEAKPLVVVFDDGGPASWPVATSPLLRITVWSDGRTRSRRLAALSMGVLLAHSIPGLTAVRQPSSILDSRDSRNRGLMASFTVRVTARTVSI